MTQYLELYTKNENAPTTGVVLNFKTKTNWVTTRTFDAKGCDPWSADREEMIDAIRILSDEMQKGNVNILEARALLQCIIEDSFVIEENDVSEENVHNPVIVEATKMIPKEQKINRIKLVRAITKCGLREAKDWVETLPEYQQYSPISDAADELREEFFSERNQEKEPDLGDILRQALEDRG